MGNTENNQNVKLGKAGRKRHLGRQAPDRAWHRDEPRSTTPWVAVKAARAGGRHPVLAHGAFWPRAARTRRPNNPSDRRSSCGTQEEALQDGSQ